MKFFKGHLHQHYFDYLSRTFFQMYPCSLAKILGAFKIKVNNKTKGTTKKLYLFIFENITFGSLPEDNIVTYDLKGSVKNRYVVQNNDPSIKTVLQDTNFLLDNNSMPIVLSKLNRKLLKACVNNDSIFLSRKNVIDYSMLAIVNKTKKTI
jgi:1-phosphatidylinositol-3-phosphate 5-kinase